MNTITSRLLLLAGTVILVFGLSASLIIQLGLGRLVADWEQNSQDQLRIAVGQRLQSLAEQVVAAPEPTDDVPISQAVGQVLSDLPVTPETLAVVGSQSKPLLVQSHGVAPPGLGKNLLQRAPPLEQWSAITLANQVIFRFWVKAPTFDAVEANRLLYATLQTTVGWALGLAAVASLGFAIGLAWPLARSARSIEAAIRHLQAGQRNLDLPSTGVREFQAIAASIHSLQANLSREAALRRQWAADIAHDLRTPISALKGQFEGLLDGVFQPDQTRLRRNFRELERLEVLVNSLGELTRLESPGFRPRFAPITLPSLLSEVVERFVETAEASGGTIRLLEAAPALPIVQADANLLDRALSNLVDNALKYGQSPVTVEVSAGVVDRQRVQLVVRNNGQINPEGLPWLFERLYRVDHSRSAAGSGLGLAIVRAIAAAHGGLATVNADHDHQLVEFRIDLPISPPL